MKSERSGILISIKEGKRENMDQKLRRRIEEHTWYHEFNFGEGVVTKPLVSYKWLWTAIEDFLDKKVDFEGRSVLDVGCWDGYWSFYAERRGAASVLATDMNTQRWFKDEKGLRPSWPSENEGFSIAREVYNSKVEYMGDVSVYDVRKLGRTFDIVLFLGVYYHLTHIMYGITQLRHMLNPGGEMIIEGGAIDDSDRSYMEFYYGSEGPEPYRSDVSNWSVPSRRCIKDMVSANYFNVTDESFIRHDSSTKAKEDSAERYGRIMLRATAVERADLNHFYEPQFGLSRFDPRFNK